MTKSDPNLTRQPSTFDERVKLPDSSEESPNAMGHDDERADEVREAIEDHREAVEEAREGEDVGPRKPGDHAGSDDSDDDGSGDSDDGGSDDDDDSDVPNGTIDEVKDWVGDDHERAQRALSAERSGQNRSTLISHLEGI